ncbi:MAG: type II secretion system protein [Rickettsiales bacterium]|nr:type II secretion system protein [Pseudomonadota bacterium]MDA0967100.1 type II secretion system protein [Pseudomonadota bacterium]MDG4542414.1 type II secretion system protein [Rickettsiales bacterium]MDG4544918.1 type II secretion system protein [Rickettsiales bacterium]MDG4547041.1 type II secretion system protein [Rickettsiales bacterium]
MRLSDKYRSKGFSLVELGVSLAIIGMIVSSAMSVAITNDFDVKKNETEAKLNRIEEALAGYVSLNHRLPCPANGATTIANTAFGQEGVVGPSAAPAICPNSNFTAGTWNNIGVVPVDTLQLPDDFMFDGWGRRFTYVVDRKYANNDVTNTSCPDTSTRCFVMSSDPTININQSSGRRITTNAVYALISHGENGHGAFTKNGSATRLNGFPVGNPYRDATASADEINNSHLSNAGAEGTHDEDYVVREYIRVDNKAAAAAARIYFDDILRYKEKHVLVKDAGAIIFDPICVTSGDIVDSPGNNQCTGASGEDDCESFAVEIYKRCLK